MAAVPGIALGAALGWIVRKSLSPQARANRAARRAARAVAAAEPVERLPRRELQALAKRCGVKANSKSAVIVEQLRELAAAAAADGASPAASPGARGRTPEAEEEGGAPSAAAPHEEPPERAGPAAPRRPPALDVGDEPAGTPPPAATPGAGLPERTFTPHEEKVRWRVQKEIEVRRLSEQWELQKATIPRGESSLRSTLKHVLLTSPRGVPGTPSRLGATPGRPLQPLNC